MPITPTYPGVYIEEIPSGVHTITGVATSVAAFLGRTVKGPINKAIRCFNYSDFTRIFGSGHSGSDLAQSLRLFFDNGGTDCYVVRLAHEARKADITLKNVDGVDVLKATAKYAGNLGNGIRLEVNYATPNPEDTFNLRVIQEDDGTVTDSESFTNLSMNPISPRYAPKFVSQSSSIIDLTLETGFNIESDAIAGYSESRRPFDATPIVDFLSALNALVHPGPGTDVRSKFEINVNGGRYIPIDLRLDPTWGPFDSSTDQDPTADEITSRINTQLAAAVTGLAVTCTWGKVHDDSYVLRITSDVVAPNSSVSICRSSTNDLAGPLMLGLDQGGIEVVRYSNHRPVPTATMLAGNINTLAADIDTLAALEQKAFDQVTIVGSTPSVDLGTNLWTTSATTGTDLWYVDGLTPDINNHNDGIHEKLRIIAKAINDAPNLPCRAEVWGYHLALIPTTGTINSIISVTTQNSGGGGTNIGAGAVAPYNLFTPNVRQYALGATGISVFQSGPGTIGRDDDGNALEVGDYTGSGTDQTGFHALDTVDLFNLMVLPGDRDVDVEKYMQLLGPASVYCQKQRAFLLIDAPARWTDPKTGMAAVVQNTAWVGDIRATVTNINSALFYPRLRYKENGILKKIGPGGAIAGLMARTDATRGVWKAPAGIEADIRNILGLDVKLTDMENGVLNKLAVNCLREFPGSYVCWGSRTLDGHDNKSSDWKYIPIRRLALFLEESLFRGTMWVVFEPNDEPLWAKIRLNVGAFMMRLFRQGAFQGSTPEKAFYVKCDEETTPQADRNLGIVNIEVGFAPLKPAEFVIIKIQQMAGEL